MLQQSSYSRDRNVSEATAYQLARKIVVPAQTGTLKLAGTTIEAKFSDCHSPVEEPLSGFPGTAVRPFPPGYTLPVRELKCLPS